LRSLVNCNVLFLLLIRLILNKLSIIFQAAWFCDHVCQSAAWPTHSLNCFAKSETAAWWGILGGTAVDQGSARDIIVLHQQRLQLRQIAAVSRAQRRSAGAAAAAHAASLRAQLGVKGGKGRGKGETEREETCAVCQCEFTVSGDSGEGMVCPSSHYLCSECTGVFVISILNDLETSFPPKCSMCRAEVPVESFERQLTSNQLEQWQEFIAQRELAASERMHKCEHCGYYEIRTDRPILWYCQMCNAGACQVCNKELPAKYNSVTEAGVDCLSSDFEEAHDRDRALRPHIIGCASLRDAKEAVDQALENGSEMPLSLSLSHTHSRSLFLHVFLSPSLALFCLFPCTHCMLCMYIYIYVCVYIYPYYRERERKRMREREREREGETERERKSLITETIEYKSYLTFV